jgi:hypothetical protein
VLNMLRGLSSKYRHAIPMITSKEPPHTFLSTLLLPSTGRNLRQGAQQSGSPSCSGRHRWLSSTRAFFRRRQLQQHLHQHPCTGERAARGLALRQQPLFQEAWSQTRWPGQQQHASPTQRRLDPGHESVDGHGASLANALPRSQLRRPRSPPWLGSPPSILHRLLLDASSCSPARDSSRHLEPAGATRCARHLHCTVVWPLDRGMVPRHRRILPHGLKCR